jgi:hypothetical protein
VHQSRAHPANLGGERTTLSLGAALTRQPIFNILEGVATGPNHNSRNAISGSGSRVRITSVLRANTSGLTPSKS